MDEIEVYFDEFLSSQKTTYKLLSNKLQSDIEKFQRLFDLQQRLFYNHLPGVSTPNYQLQEYEKIVIQSYIKTTHLIFSVHELILRGNYGSAKILMRQIFEYLIIGKYVEINKNNRIAEKWLANRNFDIFEKILKLLKIPDKKNLFEFWKTLCNLAHAKTSSLQIGIGLELSYEEILVTYRMNLIFLYCKNSLLLNNFINNKLKFYSEIYGFKKDENQNIMSQLESIKKEVLELFSESGIDVINDYNSQWEFKK